MNLVFLGTSSGIPTRRRGLSAIALELPSRRETWLLDCGEGTLHAFTSGHANLARLRRVFITHLHGDHIYGLMGVLSSRALLRLKTPVDVYGPAPLARYIRVCAETTLRGFGYPVTVHELEPGVAFEEDGWRVRCAHLEHRVTTLGYRIEEPPRAGRFDLDKARAMAIPEGPIYGRLQAGETVLLEDGRSVHGADLLGPQRPGRVVALCTDTTWCPAAVDLARDADLAVQRKHATASMAAGVAQEAGARQLYLTHFSPRYETGSPVTVDGLLAEARAIFSATDLAEDGLRVPIPARQG